MKVSILLFYSNYSFSCLGSLFSQGFHSPGQEGIHTLHVIPIAYVKLNHNYLACIPRINARKLREHAVISENRSHVRVQKRKVHDKRQSQIEKKFTLAWLEAINRRENMPRDRKEIFFVSQQIYRKI